MERIQGAPPVAKGGMLFGLQGRQLIRLGVVLIAVGIALFLGSMLPVFFAISSLMADPFGSSGGIFGAFILSFCLGAAGLIILAIGGIALRFGMIRPVASYVAAEAGPAITSVAESAGLGFRGGFGGTPVAAPDAHPDVRVKCRNCGYLDSEDATYCSKCGQPL